LPVTYDLANKTAVVTGGAKGIGRTISERLHRAGAWVWSWDIDPAPSDHIAQISVDVTNPGHIERAIERVVAETSRIDILVNNAGITAGSASLEAFEPNEWRRVIEVNLIGAFEVSRQVVPVMRRSGWGRIVNMASLAGKEGTPNMSAYSASKAGVIAMTKAVAKELAETDIRVNCVAPAAIETDILKQLAPENVAIMIAKRPMKRLGTVDEAADLVLWLCSEACSFNTGAVFDLSGGRATYWWSSRSKSFRQTSL
jgi:3-oxoacyl-[acyl-carrier protein] reductase